MDKTKLFFINHAKQIKFIKVVAVVAILLFALWLGGQNDVYY